MFNLDKSVLVKLLSVGVSREIVASVPETATLRPLVKFKEPALLTSDVPFSFTTNSAGAEALTVELESITTPFNVRFDPSNKICLLALPNTILPFVRSMKAPVSVPPGAAFASGILPPFIVPAVISPRFAERAERVAV